MHLDKFSSENLARYGLVLINDEELLFRSKLVAKDGIWKNFIDKYFDDFKLLYFTALKNDAIYPGNRKRKLGTFLKSIYDQPDFNVALIMVKALVHFIDDLSESELIGKVINQVLPQAGYSKILDDNGRYIWKVNNEKLFHKGIGKIFAITYINSSFDRDVAWKEIKKHCYCRNGTWVYKGDRNKRLIEKAFKSYFNSEGVIVSDVKISEPKKFEAFFEIGKIVTEDGEDYLSLEKEVREKKHPVLKGLASDTSPDRDDERVSSNFIDKMRRTGKGLPIFDNTHYPESSKSVIGTVTKTGGDENNFAIEVKLMKPSDSENVAFIIKQFETGIKYGFSIGGRITKVYREFNDTMKKEIWVFDDGELFHIALTVQPSNARTLGVAISKTLSDTDKKFGETALSYRHNSRLHKSAPVASDVDVDKLPDEAFPKDHISGSLFKEYPHHFVSDKGALFLHRDLAIQSYAKAIQNKAPETILNHLANHLCVIGLDKQAEAIQNLTKTIDDSGNAAEKFTELVKELRGFFSAVKSVGSLQGGIDEKKKMLKSVTMEVSQKVSNILISLKEEGATNG